MYALLVVIVFLFGLGLGAALLALFLCAGAYEERKCGKFAFAYYSERKKRWDVYGNYLTIAGKIADKLKASPDKASPEVRYIE